jgi:hypothetical protein
MLWVDAESPTDQELADLRQRFGLDEYAVEDVVHRNQRPKMEDYGKNVFAVVHVPVVKGHSSEIIELFVFFQKNWIITIHSVDSELIHSVDARIRARGLSPLTTSPSPDLLFYIFLDFAVDAYYPILDEEENRQEGDHDVQDACEEDGEYCSYHNDDRRSAKKADDPPTLPHSNKGYAWDGDARGGAIRRRRESQKLQRRLRPFFPVVGDD